jgi:hypothetical protein
MGSYKGFKLVLRREGQPYEENSTSVAVFHMSYADGYQRIHVIYRSNRRMVYVYSGVGGVGHWQNAFEDLLESTDSIGKGLFLSRRRSVIIDDSSFTI